MHYSGAPADVPVRNKHTAFYPSFSSVGIARVRVHYARRRGEDWEEFTPPMRHSLLPTDLHIWSLYTPIHHLVSWLQRSEAILDVLSDMLGETLDEVRVVLDGGVYIAESSFDAIEKDMYLRVSKDSDLETPEGVRAALSALYRDGPMSELSATLWLASLQALNIGSPYMELFDEGGMGTLVLSREDKEGKNALKGLNLGFQNPAIDAARYDLKTEEVSELFDEVLRLYEEDNLMDLVDPLVRVLQARPTFAEANRYLGNIHFRSCAFMEAVACLEVAELAGGLGPWALVELQYERAKAWHCLAEHERALLDYDAAIRNAESQGAPKHIHYVSRAELFLDMGRIDEVEADLKRALELDPTDEEALVLKSRLALARDRSQLGGGWFSRLLELFRRFGQKREV